MARTKRLYRVVSIHPINGNKDVTYHRTRHFQSKGSAEDSERRMRAGIPLDPSDDPKDLAWYEFAVEPALSVRIDVSDPIVFPADTKENA